MAKSKRIGSLSLLLGIISLVLLVLACLPMQELHPNGLSTGVMLSGWINVVFAGGGLLTAIAALITGIFSKKGGKRTLSLVGRIVGIACLIGSVLTLIATTMFAMLSDYANDPANSYIGQHATDPEALQRIDNVIKELIDSHNQ